MNSHYLSTKPTTVNHGVQVSEERIGTRTLAKSPAGLCGRLLKRLAHTFTGIWPGLLMLLGSLVIMLSTSELSQSIGFALTILGALSAVRRTRE
jgi:hypothetical protein